MNGRYSSVVLGIAWRNLHNYFTNPGMIIPGLFFPLFFFIAFAGGLAAVRHIPGFAFPSGYTSFQFVFVFLQSAAFAGVFNGFSIARDFESGFAKRFLLAAPSRSAIVVGYALAALCRWGFNAMVVTVVAVAFGMNVDGSPSEMFALVVLGILFNFAGTLWSAGVALRTRTVQAGPLMQTPVFLLLFVAPVFVPLALLQGWIHTVARYNPVTYLLEAGRGFISGHPVEVGLAFGLVCALLAVLTVWALRGMRKAENAG